MFCFVVVVWAFRRNPNSKHDHHKIKNESQQEKNNPSKHTAKEIAMGHEENKNKAATDQEEEAWNQRKQALIEELSDKLINGDLETKIEAARDIRKVVKKSSLKTRSEFAAAGVVQPLVLMLVSPNLDAIESSLLALLNLAVRNERFVSHMSHIISSFCFRMTALILFSILFQDDCFDFSFHLIVKLVEVLVSLREVTDEEMNNKQSEK